jgi:arylsulfatase A-like enzyme
MNSKFLLSTLPVLMTPLQSNSAKNKTPDDRPNIILIMADDMGFSDLGFMGAGIETPNLDKLAGDGLLFTNFYNAGRSCPTRASLLTGLYAHQTGLGWMTSANLGHPGYTGDMNNQAVTIAQVLKTADYSCYVTGKWHVTFDRFMRPEGPKHNWPMQRGFDRFFGHLAGGGGFFKPETLTNDNEQLEAPDGFYLTTAVTDSTVRIINQHFEHNKKNPFFFYVAYYAPHRPLHALQEDIAKYRGKFMDGWDVHRERRYAKLRELNIIDEKFALTERDPRIPAWNTLSEEDKIIWDAKMAVYAAQMDRMDQGIGAIIETLKANDALDNTLILFLTDNGGNAESQGGKLTLEQLPLLGNEEPAQSYRRNWGNVSNTPFREYKRYVHEGGIATPLIAHWPAKIKQGGSLTSQQGHVIDFMPTFIEMAGAKYPKTFNGHAIHPLPGKSLLPTMTKGKTFKRGSLYFEHEANRAIIDGDWKLVSKATNSAPYISDWELYNLKEDRTETNNLAEKYPRRVKNLAAKWDKWAKENNVYPLDNSGWAGKNAKNQGPPL